MIKWTIIFTLFIASSASAFDVETFVQEETRPFSYNAIQENNGAAGIISEENERIQKAFKEMKEKDPENQELKPPPRDSMKDKMAESMLLEALANSPKSNLPHFNLGYLYEMGGKPERALKEYDSVLREVDKGRNDGYDARVLSFYTNFNAGNTAAKLKNIPLALKYYQAALDIAPDSQEVRNNIELLFMQGQGKGKGKGKSGGDQSEENDDDGQGNQDPNQQPNDDKKDKKKFNSEKLTQDDVKKILEELKAQEQKIRAMDYGGKKSKDGNPEKDW